MRKYSKKLPLLILGLMAVVAQAWPQYNIYIFQPGARSAAMTHASVTNRDIWASFHNQANLGFISNGQLGFHAENRFYTERLASGSFAGALPLQTGGVAFANISYFGYDLYNESKTGLGYALQLSDMISAAVQLDLYTAFQSENLGTAQAVTYEIGLAAHVNEYISFGAHLINPNSAQLKNIEEYNIPSVVSAGMSFRLDDFMLNGELEKDYDFPAIFRAGAEYRLIPTVLLRGGISNGFSKYAFGIGFALNNMEAGFAFASHGVLGFTPHFSLTYHFNNPEKTLGLL